MLPSYERTWENRRKSGRSVTDESRRSYYNIPAVHKPHWKWLIIFYFFLGGISSASYVIASVTELFGGRDARRITQVGRYLSLAALIPSPILLILDLGRPERFHHMLYILKLRSPMSVGTWGLTIFGGFCGLSALIQAAQDGLFRRTPLPARLLLALPSRLINVVGSVFGFFVGGYTGVLLGATAVPLWAKNYLLLGPLFLSSAMSTAVAAITLVLALLRSTSHRTLKNLEDLDTLTLMIEIGLILSARANAGRVIAKPVREGRLGQIFRWGVLSIGISLPLALQSIGRLTDKISPRLVAGLSSMLVLIGGFLLRYVMVIGGRVSADDPQSTFEFTRKNKERRTKNSE